MFASEEIAIRAIVDREIDTYDPYEGEVMVWARQPARAASRRRGAGSPSRMRRSRRSPEIEGETASFDAHDLSTRQINLELRWLLYEQGIKEVTVRTPGRSTRSGWILTRCKITFEGSLGYFGCGLIDGPEIRITGRVGWSLREHGDVRRCRRRRERRPLTGAAFRGGDLVIKGQVGARTGIDQKGGTIITMGDAGSMTGFMMQRGCQIICGNVGPGLGDSMYDGTIYVAGKVKALGIGLRAGRMGRVRHRVRGAEVSDLWPRRAARVPEVRLRQDALQLRQPRALRAEARPLGARHDDQRPLRP